MKKHVLVIEDCGILVDSYKEIFKDIFVKNGVEILPTFLRNCSQVENFLVPEKSVLYKYDLVLLDISLGRDASDTFINGIDIGKFIKKCSPDIKIFICTAVDDKYTLFNIFKDLNPDGFLLKYESGYRVLLTAIHQVLMGETYLGQSILKMMRNHLFSNLKIDDTDRKMVHLLSQGYKLADIPKVDIYSKGAYEARKSKLMTGLNIVPSDDRKLIQAFKERYLI